MPIVCLPFASRNPSLYLSPTKSFYYNKPFLADPASNKNASFVAAFADWAYDRGAFSTPFLIDDCCSASDVDLTFNPTCP